MTKQHNGQLMWVSEWRIIPDYNEYKISNGGVYCTAETEREAKIKLEREVRDEMLSYRRNNLSCPYCYKRFAEHDGMDYAHCLINLAIRGLGSN